MTPLIPGLFSDIAPQSVTVQPIARESRASGRIEREEKYCEIAAMRLSQGALPLEFMA